MKKQILFFFLCAVFALTVFIPALLPSKDKITEEIRFSRSFLGAYAKTSRFHLELENYAERYEVDLNLILAIAMAESSGNDGEFFENEKWMISPVGAKGLMQVMPETKKGLEKDDKKKYTYMEAGVRYVRVLVNQYRKMKERKKDFSPLDDSELKSFVVQAYNGGADNAYNGEVKNQSMFFLQRVSLYSHLISLYKEELEEIVAKRVGVVILEEQYTWQKLAEKMNIGVIELRLYNPLISFCEPAVISKGRAIAFPKEKDRLSLEVRLDNNGKPKDAYYIVQAGDTFHDLANSFFRRENNPDSAVHLKELRNKNGLLKWGAVQAGMRLNVTGSPYLDIPQKTKNSGQILE